MARSWRPCRVSHGANLVVLQDSACSEWAYRQNVCKVGLLCLGTVVLLEDATFGGITWRTDLRADGGGPVVLRIEESGLDNVLLAHKDAIGSLSVGHGIADAVAGVFYIATAFSAGFPVVLLVVLAIIGLLLSCYGR